MPKTTRPFPTIEIDEISLELEQVGELARILEDKLMDEDEHDTSRSDLYSFYVVAKCIREKVASARTAVNALAPLVIKGSAR